MEDLTSSPEREVAVGKVQRSAGTVARGSGDRPGRRDLDAALRLHADVAELTGISLPVRLWNGTELGDPSLGFTLVLRRPWSARAMLHRASDLAAGEAYVHGDTDIEGDIVAAVAVARRISQELPATATPRLLRSLLALPRPPRRRADGRAHLHGRTHSRERDREAIAFHYDHPQAFYERFLDVDLVYSCAYFAHPGEPLEDAQRRKLDLVCRKLRLRPGVRLLDIGCGWGSLLAHAAEHYGVTGIGVTLSETQARAGTDRLRARGLNDRVTIRLTDYRDLDEEFDAVSSIGMFEHVGPDRLGEYFAHVHRLTAPGGLMLNHGIVAGDPQPRRGASKTFVSTHVFPDGGLVPAWRALRAMEVAGFEAADVEQLRPHYALTLREWLRRLERHHQEVQRITSEQVYRTWRVYMAGAAAGFEHGGLGVVQLLGSKGHPLPLGRGWMLPPS